MISQWLKILRKIMDLEIWVFNDDRCEDVEMSDGWGAEHNEGVLSDLEEIALHQQAVWTCWVWTEWDELKWNQWICTDDILIHRNLHGHIGYQSLKAIFNVVPVAACLIALALPCLPNISAKNARKLKRLKVWKPAVDISSHLASHIFTEGPRLLSSPSTPISSLVTVITVHLLASLPYQPRILLLQNNIIPKMEGIWMQTVRVEDSWSGWQVVTSQRLGSFLETTLLRSWPNLTFQSFASSRASACA